MAFLVTFSALLIAGIVWMGLFMWLDGANSAPLNVAAAWLSPDGVLGWLFYLALAFACFWPLAQWKHIFEKH
jgi:hypothetical protein